MLAAQSLLNKRTDRSQRKVVNSREVPVLVVFQPFSSFPFRLFGTFGGTSWYDQNRSLGPKTKSHNQADSLARLVTFAGTGVVRSFDAIAALRGTFVVTVGKFICIDWDSLSFESDFHNCLNLNQVPMPPLKQTQRPLAGESTDPASGFTLIELLTVIVVIGILAAILIPVAGNMRQSALQTESLSKLRQIGSALLLYKGENNGRFPYSEGNTLFSKDETPNYWQDELLRYVGDWSVQARAEWFHDPAGEPIDITPGWTHGAYTGHQAVFGMPSPNNDYQQNRKPLQITYPSDKILVYTGTQVIDGQGALSVGGWDPWPGIQNASRPIPVPEDPESASGGISYRLDGAAGCLMVDGSVRKMEKGTITYRNWNPAL